MARTRFTGIDRLIFAVELLGVVLVVLPVLTGRPLGLLPVLGWGLIGIASVAFLVRTQRTT